MSLRNAIAVNNQPLAQLQLVAHDFYEWQSIDITCEPQTQAVAAQLRINDADLGAPTTTFGDSLWRWRWNPQHAVGRFTATLTVTHADSTRLTETFELRIVPRKLDVEQYEALIEAMQRDVYGLVYALAGGREGGALQSGAARQRSLIEEYVALVDGHVIVALAVAKQIVGRPQESLTSQAGMVSLAAAERIDAAALADVVRGPLDDVADDLVPALQAALRPADQTRGGPLPRAVPTRRTFTTHDSIEHRLMKHVLRVLEWRVGVVRDMLRRELGRRQRTAQIAAVAAPVAVIESWLRRCSRAGGNLRSALALPFFDGVGSMPAVSGPTHLMRGDPRYRRLWAIFRALRTTPFIAFDSPALALPISDLPLLYEQWCALQLVKAVLPLGELVTQQLVASEDDTQTSELRWTLRLQHNTPLVVVRGTDGAELSLVYQRRYQPQSATSTDLGALDPFVRVPDLALEVKRAGQPSQVLIFDAKYRVAPDGRVPQDALDDAYAYRGAIGVAGARATLGSFLLFPGAVPLATSDHVGAISLLPGQPTELAALVKQFVISMAR